MVSACHVLTSQQAGRFRNLFVEALPLYLCLSLLVQQPQTPAPCTQQERLQATDVFPSLQGGTAVGSLHARLSNASNRLADKAAARRKCSAHHRTLHISVVRPAILSAQHDLEVVVSGLQQLRARPSMKRAAAHAKAMQQAQTTTACR